MTSDFSKSLSNPSNRTMFGVIAAGRMVDTNPSQVDSTKYLVQLHDASSINHLVVFLLGSIPFPPGFGATVHFLWPSTTNPSWVGEMRS